MKTKYFFIAAAFAATSMFLQSCKDDLEPIEQDGDATTMTVAISFPQVKTRATSDLYGTEGESMVNTVDVYVYNAVNGNFVSHKRLSGADFSQAASGTDRDNWNVAAKIPTTTGERVVFAGINLPQTVAEGLVGKPVSALANSAQDMTKKDLMGDTYNNFAMFSEKGTKVTLLDDESKNNVTLVCKRLVAKVVVEQADDMKVEGVPGKLTNLTYAINNFNLKTLLLQGDAPFRKDANWAKGSYNVNEFVKLSNNYVEVKEHNAAANYTSPPLYAAENTSEGKTKKEITRATVRGQFVPDKVATWDGKALIHVDNPDINAAPQTFYAVVASIYDGTYYFIDKKMADDFADYKNNEFGYTGDDLIKPIKYTDGYCYWDIFLNRNAIDEENQWDVLRNEFYRCKITRVTTPGRSGPDLEDEGGGGSGPDEKPDVNTNISVNIEILHWLVRPFENVELY